MKRKAKICVNKECPNSRNGNVYFTLATTCLECGEDLVPKVVAVKKVFLIVFLSISGFFLVLLYFLSPIIFPHKNKCDHEFISDKTFQTCVGKLNAIEPLSLSILYQFQPQKMGNWQVLNENKVINVGDAIKITFTAPESMHVYIYAMSSQGLYEWVTELSQRKKLEHSIFEAGTTYSIPSEKPLNNGKIVKAKISSTGKQKIYFMALRNKNEFLDNQYRLLSHARYRKDIEKVEALEKSIVTYLDSLPNTILNLKVFTATPL